MAILNQDTNRTVQRYLPSLCSLIAMLITTSCASVGRIDKAVSKRTIACGSMHAVAIRDGEVVAWGDNSYGQCSVPPGLNDVVQVASGSRHTVALRRDGRVIAWGENSGGQCDIPFWINNGYAIAAGIRHTAILTRNGKIWVIGKGRDNEAIRTEDLQGKVSDIAASGYSVFALLSNGGIQAWGHPDDNKTPLFAVIPSIRDASRISYGDNLAIVRNDGSLTEFGDNHEGMKMRCKPKALRDVKDVSVGGSFTAVLLRNGRVAVWGSNDSGECNVPANARNLTEISSGSCFIIARRKDGSIAAWGNNLCGQCNVPQSLSEWSVEYGHKAGS